VYLESIIRMDNDDRLTLTVDETRKKLGLSRGLIYQAIHKGEIPSVRIGRRILIPRAALEKLLANPGTPNIPAGRPTG
jgi:excisionase family DNA binding protein